MLCKLSISNIAVIDKAEITLENGFSVLTGETGAGKSLIIDAIMMVLGTRTGRDIIRAGEKCAVCEAAFFVRHPEADEEGMLLLRRELYADGRNLCSINGKMVPVAGLKAVGESLLALHGQQDTGRLLHRGSHLAFVDGFAGSTAARKTYGALYEKRCALLEEIAALRQDDGEKIKRLEMLHFWIEEIEAAAPVPGEEEALSERREYLRHSEKIRVSAEKAYGALCGEEGAARDLLSAAARELDSVSTYDARLQNALESIRDALYQAEETAGVLRDISEEETDREALEAAEERLDILRKLQNKYGGTIEAVLEELAEMKEEAEKIETAGERLAALEAELIGTEAEMQKAAAALSDMRKKAGEEISVLVEKELGELDMAKVRFSVTIQPKEYGPSGADDVEFFIATNPVEALKPLSKIASGGELSRVCLALQTVLALHTGSEADTLIFDEIDSGISGRAAQKVGEKLQALAEKKQILCVTHLPQIAAKADAQFTIEKKDTEKGFSTIVTALSPQARVQEIARMISGDSITAKTLETAEEMLK